MVHHTVGGAEGLDIMSQALEVTHRVFVREVLQDLRGASNSNRVSWGDDRRLGQNRLLVAFVWIIVVILSLTPSQLTNCTAL